MKRIVWILLVVMVMVACKIDDNGSAGNAPNTNSDGEQNDGQGNVQFFGPQGTLDPTAAATFRDYDQTVVGMLYLQGTNHPINKDQATTLLPIFEEMNAPRPALQPGETPTPGAGRRFNTQAMADTVSKIKAILTSDQTQLINNMTQEQMTATLQKYNINNGRFGFGSFAYGGPDNPTAQAFATQRAEGTPFPTRDPNQVATFQAQRGSNDQIRSDPLIEEVIKVLQAIING